MRLRAIPVAWRKSIHAQQLFRSNWHFLVSFSTYNCGMAANHSQYLPLDTDFLLEYFDTLPGDDSGSEFDGYVDEDAEDEIEQVPLITSFVPHKQASIRRSF